MTKDKIDPYKWLLDRDPEAATVLVRLGEGATELVDLLIRNLYGELYQRERLDERTRFLLTVASAASVGAIPQVTYQSRLAMLSGVDVEELYETLFHVAIFTGFSNAMNAMNAIRDAVATIDRSTQRSEQVSD